MCSGVNLEDLKIGGEPAQDDSSRMRLQLEAAPLSNSQERLQHLHHGIQGRMAAGGGAHPGPGWTWPGSVGAACRRVDADLGREAGFEYSFSQCADPVVVVCFACGAPGGGALLRVKARWLLRWRQGGSFAEQGGARCPGVGDGPTGRSGDVGTACGPRPGRL